MSSSKPDLPSSSSSSSTTDIPIQPPAITPSLPARATEKPTSRIPNSGIQAWTQVLGSFCIMTTTWGLVNTFGVFQTHHELHLPQSASEISWIGSLQASLLLITGLASGPLYDAGYFRTTVAAGLALIVLGMFMTSLASAYWHFLLAQGLCVGLGMGLAFLPSTAILAQWFDSHRALAIGVASAGSPLGGIVFPIVFSRLEPRVGFGWATRTVAFIILALAVVPVAFMRVRVPPASKRALFDKTALTDGPFLLATLAAFAAFLVLYVPFFYVQAYAVVRGAADTGFAPYMVTFLNVGSVFGRVVPGWAGDRFGSLNTSVVCATASAVLAFAWLGCESLGALTVFALLYGAFSGGIVGLAPSVTVGLTPDIGRVGARMGMSFVVIGIAVLVGTPVAGAILGEQGWTSVIGFTGASLTGSVVLYCGARYLVYRRKAAVVA